VTQPSSQIEPGAEAVTTQGTTSGFQQSNQQDEQDES
jgi:hypothetical protein